MAPDTKEADAVLAASFQYGSSFMTPAERKEPRRTFLFGYPIAHSLAPLLHATLFKGLGSPWTYKLHETQDASEFLPALKQNDIVGCAVTMPYKVVMSKAVDDVTEEGRMIGAINTVFLRRAPDGSTRYIGSNTDCSGIREAFVQNYPDWQRAAGKPSLVIGGGGACRAAIYALWRWLGASRVYVANRLASEVADIVDWFTNVGCGVEIVFVSSVEQATKLETPTLIVGTVPDFPPKEPGEIVARQVAEEFLGRPDKGCILEMCYHPHPRTLFFALGEKAGWQMIDGTEPMIWQGVAQQSLWTEMSLDKFKLDDVHSTIRKAVEGHGSAL